MAIKAKYAQEYDRCYAPRVGLWLSKKWPFRGTRYSQDIAYAYTVGITNQGHLEVGSDRLSRVHLWAATSSGILTFLTWQVFQGASMNPLTLLGLFWTMFNATAAVFHWGPAPSGERSYKKAWRIWSWGRGLEYFALTVSVALFVVLYASGAP